MTDPILAILLSLILSGKPVTPPCNQSPCEPTWVNIGLPSCEISTIRGNAAQPISGIRFQRGDVVVGQVTAKELQRAWERLVPGCARR